MLALAATRGLHVHYGYHVETLSAEGDGWLLNQQRNHQAVVLANGHSIADFAQTAQLPVYPVGGQVSIYLPPRGFPPCARCCATMAT
jgi:tRNA 5-methylaminomethyl-2-thiouridine biosynthesis bifunctional protein